MVIRKKLIYTMMLLGITSMPAMAQVSVDINIGVAPPPMRYESVPQVDYGHVWIPGYWDWNHGRHIWVSGHQIQSRPGYVWGPDHWEQNGKKWHLVRGDWREDEHYDNRDRNWKRDNENNNNRPDWNQNNGIHKGNYTGNDYGDYDHRTRRNRK